jgi:hypothetical protein
MHVKNSRFCLGVEGKVKPDVFEDEAIPEAS